MPETGRYITLSWQDIVDIIHEKYNSNQKQVWYLGGFVPPEQGNMRIEIPDDEEKPRTVEA